MSDATERSPTVPFAGPHDGLSSRDLELLRERARMLFGSREATERGASHFVEERDAYLCFQLLNECCGLPLTCVREAIPLASILRLPNVPDHVVGLTRVRGAILTLIDLRRFWHRDSAGYADAELVVVVEAGGLEFGLVCTAVHGLARVGPDDTREIPKNLPLRVAATLRGLAHRDILLIDPDKLLAQPGFVVGRPAQGSDR